MSDLTGTFRVVVNWRNDLALKLTCETGEALNSGEITWAEYLIAKDAIAGLAEG